VEVAASGTARLAGERSDRAPGRPTTTAEVESAVVAAALIRPASEVAVWASEVAAAVVSRRRTTETTT